MSDFRLVNASDVGVQPAILRGKEYRGLVFFTSEHSFVVGAQCRSCNNIVWTNPASNIVLSEKKPDNVPTHGDGYKKYYHDNIKRFLLSVPPCPICGNTVYDRFVNNVHFPRFSGGETMDDCTDGSEIVNLDPKLYDVWFFL